MTKDKNKFLVRLIDRDSQEYQQACQLRYQLFYQEHNLPYSIVLDKSDRHFHAAIVLPEGVVAYGKLIPHRNLTYQISQMVVKPNYQGRNLGKQILLTLINLAQREGAIAIKLNSRLSAVAFYQKLGFQTYGKKFPSSTTGVMHISMKLMLPAVK